MNRRTFLMTAAAPGAPRRIIDTHTHFYDPSRKQGVPWPPKNDSLLYRTVLPGEYRKMTEPMGVRGTVVVEASEWLEDNQWVLDLARRNPILVGLVGRLEAGRPGFAASLERFGKNRRFLGIRQSGGTLAERMAQPEFHADLKRLAAAGLELDVVGSPAMLADVLRITDRTPELRVVIDHLPFERSKHDGALKEMRQRVRVYAKVSNVQRTADRAAMDELWDIFGEDRLIYGSNWPVSDRFAPYARVLGQVREYFAAKGTQASEKYFWKNGQAAYRFRL